MIQQANEIASRFAGFAREDAIEHVRQHLQRFWDREQREQLFAHIARGGEGLNELVVEAARLMRKDA
jgi:formate dehydrogenase subunit delta